MRASKLELVGCKGTGLAPTKTVGGFTWWHASALAISLTVAVSGFAGEDPGQAVPPHERLLTGEDVKRAEELDKLIQEAEAGDRYDEAIERIESLRSLRQRVQGADHWEVETIKWELDALRKLAALNSNERAGWRLAVEAVREAEGFEAKRQFAKSQPHWEEYRRWCVRVFGERHPRTATSFSNLAYCLQAQGKTSEALTLRERALEIDRSQLGDNHPDVATDFQGLAEVLEAKGDLAVAQSLFQQALELRRTVLGEKHRDTALSYFRFGMHLRVQGKDADAQPFFQQVLDLCRKLHGESHPETASSYNNLGANLEAQGRYDDAEAYYQKALEIYRELPEGHSSDMGAPLNNLAIVLYVQGKHEEADERYQEALKAVGRESVESATIYNGLAVNLNAQGRYADAEPILRKALELREQLLDAQDPDIADSCNNLANNLQSQRKFDEVPALRQRALALYRTRYGDNHPSVAAAYNNLAGTLGLQGERVEARKYFEKSLEISRALLGEHHPDTSQRYENLASNLHQQGELSEALQFGSHAATSYEAARLNVAQRGTDRALFGNKHSPYRLIAATAARLALRTRAWEAAEADLARALSDEHLGSQLSDEEESERVRLLQRMGQVQVQIRRQVARRNPDASQQAELAKLQTERGELNAGLNGLAALRSRREIAALSDVQSAIPEHAALILWIDVVSQSGLEEHWGCVVRDSGEPAWEPLPGTGPGGIWTADDTDRPAKLRAELVSGRRSAAEVNTMARALFAQRIAPMLPHLSGVNTLYVVAVNAMSCIPIEILTRDFIVSYLPSGTQLVRLREDRRTPTGGLLAIGDPDFSRPDTATTDLVLAANRKDQWSDLPDSRVEAAQIATLFGKQSTLLLDSAASEQSLEHLRRQGDLLTFRYLHFATHGEANNARAFESALILAQDQLPDDALPRAREAFLNGKLSGREVLDLWKLNAELVTLSACETAIGRTGGGDGLLGFSQAFLAAGSRAVCLSLWEVDDSSTALLMLRFYQNLLGKRSGLTMPMPKARALAEAKSWLRDLPLSEVERLLSDAKKTGPPRVRGKSKFKPSTKSGDVSSAPDPDKPFFHPRYWSGFILIGDPN